MNLFTCTCSDCSDSFPPIPSAAFSSVRIKHSDDADKTGPDLCIRNRWKRLISLTVFLGFNRLVVSDRSFQMLRRRPRYLHEPKYTHYDGLA